uniref:REC114 meiotic recombination protein n=1 Tax=Monopterus albus TaxID=43700 RepID=A0A3Q3JFD4_MONAL|nr:meiotic recombination protein REC114 isoform X1 [Monopterus albus]XP_020448039.1 meiotic recombination protein REC114 isoform X1 [Monopterus albus]
MATGRVWKLKRYGRLVPASREIRRELWKVFEVKRDKPEIVLTIVESGYLLVSQGQESLDTIFLVTGSDSLKVHQRSDNLMLRLTLEGESRLIRMQFDGRSRAEAIKECSSALEKLMEYVPVTTEDDAPLPSNQPPSETSRVTAMGVEPEVVPGSLSLKRLAQHYLGEAAVTLPRAYYHGSLEQGDLEPLLRVCLLDPSFPAFVEKVEEELKKLVQE